MHHRPHLQWRFLFLAIPLILLIAVVVVHVKPSAAQEPPVVDATHRVFIPNVSNDPPIPTATPTEDIEATRRARRTPTPTRTPTRTPTHTPTSTPVGVPTSTSEPNVTPSPTQQLPPPAAGEWSQFGHNAQRTSFQPNAVDAPWRWMWSWNGPTANGDVSTDKARLPRNSQPVTGGGRVYVAAGNRGVVALHGSTGSVLWFRSPGGAINSTPAYDAQSGALFVVSSNGRLYKLDAASGNTLGEVAANGTSDLPLPPAIAGNTVFFSMGTQIVAVDAATLGVRWRYDAGSPVDTPPAYSTATDTVVAVSRDLFVHGVRGATGQQAWRVKPTNRTPSTTTVLSKTQAESRLAWPVIAEGHGLVFIRYRLDWDTLWTWSPWPNNNGTMRNNLLANPNEQSLYALRLGDGAVAFVPNVGNGAYGDGDYMPMGPPPAIRRLDDGGEVAYVVMRGTPCLPGTQGCDGRGDARLAEMVLDDGTVSGNQAGYVRYMDNTHFPTDEMPYLSAAGDQLFAGHWEAGIAHRVLDRSASRGTSANPITTSDLPHIATSQDQDICGAGFSTSHYCAAGLANTRTWPSGFYIFWKQGAVYDRFWSEYASYVVSGGLVLYVSTDGTVVALESGLPTAASDRTLVGAAPSSFVMTAEATSSLQAASVETGRPVVQAGDARSAAGTVVTVEGVLQDVFNNGKAVYLGFHKPHRGYFLVRIRQEQWKNFSAPPETLYAPGDRVRVSGLVQWYQGDPVIYVTDPEQIRLHPGDDAVAAVVRRP